MCGRDGVGISLHSLARCQRGLSGSKCPGHAPIHPPFHFWAHCYPNTIELGLQHCLYGTPFTEQKAVKTRLPSKNCRGSCSSRLSRSSDLQVNDFYSWFQTTFTLQKLSPKGEMEVCHSKGQKSNAVQTLKSYKQGLSF